MVFFSNSSLSQYSFLYTLVLGIARTRFVMGRKMKNRGDGRPLAIIRHALETYLRRNINHEPFSWLMQFLPRVA